MDLYNVHKENMKTGDCLQWQSYTALGWLIRKFTGGVFNHTGLIIRFDQYDVDHRWTIEALEHGIQLRLLSDRIKNFKGKVWWYPLKDEYDHAREGMGRWALQKIGTPYDYGSLFKQMISRVSADAKNLFCSEFAYLDWKIGGGIILPDVPAPRPVDIPELDIFKHPLRIF